MKEKFYYCLILSVVFALSACVHNSKSGTNTSESDSLVEVTVEEDPEALASDDGSASGGNEAQSRYDAKLRELEGAADYIVKYSDGRYIWYNLTTPYGYSTSLSVYDSETDNTSHININKTSMSDDEVTVHEISEHNGKITVLLEEYRNSNGWVEGTYVWTIDCATRTWKCVANGVAGAEFVNGGSAVKITEAKILNPDDPTFMQKYKKTTKTITL